MSRYASLRLRCVSVLGCCLAVCCSISCQPARSLHKLRFYHFWAEPSQRVAMESLLAKYHAAHPEIEIEVTELSWSDGKTKLMLGFNSGTAPDLLELGSDWVPQFSSSGVLLDMTAPADSNFAARFASAPSYALAPSNWNGHQYAIPWLLDTRVMFVNDSLAQQSSMGSPHPLLHNWDAMRALCQGVAKHGAQGCGINGADEHRLYKKFLPYVWSNGGELFDAHGAPTLARPENIEALRYYVEQQNYGRVDAQKALDDGFVRGQIGVWFSGSWILPALQKVSFKWHTELMPGNSCHWGESFAGGEYLAINAKSPMQKEARSFLEFITRPENELAFAKAVNMFPADTAMQRDSFYLTRREGPVFAEQLRNARMTPVLPQWLEVEAILEEEVSEALYYKKTPKAALESAQARVEELLSQP